MLKYEWKRYWSPVSQEIYVDYDGYLPDPDTINWRYNNFSPKPIGFESIADQHCLVLLGEAGMGKTTAMEAAHQLTYQQPKNSDDICLPLFRLGDYSSDGDLCNVIFKNQDFQKWIQGSYKLHLFLDSLDEGLLSIDNLIRSC
jgi:hypothetical protein